MSETEDILTEHDDGIGIVRINRPSTKNALLPSTCERFGAAVDAFGADSAVRCIVVTGSRAGFCAGADLMAGMSEAAQRPYADVIRNGFHRMIRAVVTAPKPVLAAIQGPAVGFGFDLALACDLRVAARTSTFGAVFSRIGLVPDGGSSFTLSRLVGLGRAMELIMLGETFDGATAERYGLLNRLLEDDAFERDVRALAGRLAAGPPMALRLMKRNALAGLSGTLDDALEREIEAQVQCLKSQDMMEGVQAFFQKRRPSFKGT